MWRPKMATIDPWEVRFSHESINARFSDGRTIDELVLALRTGLVSSEDVAPIRLVERGGQLYTLDNRRLEAFRRAGVEIAYRMATDQEAEDEEWKFTTTNAGVSVRM